MADGMSNVVEGEQMEDVSRFLKKDHSGGMSNVVEGELINWAKTTDYNGPIGITVKFIVKDSEVSNFQTICQKNHDFAKSLEGCKVFKMNQDFKSQSCFWLVEEWDSIAAWKTYLLSDERSANAKALMPMMKEPPHLVVNKIVSRQQKNHSGVMSNVKEGEMMNWAKDLMLMMEERPRLAVYKVES